MTKRKIAGWIMLPVVYAAFFGVLALVLEAQEEQEMAVCCSDMPPSVTPPPERPAPSTRVREVVEAEPVAFGLDLACEGFPWRVYSTMPLMYQPPCAPGQMVRVTRSRRTPAEELEEARAENTALHERLREMAETEAGGERPASLCERYAEAAERVVGGWYEELNRDFERAREKAGPHGPAVGGPNEWEFWASYRTRGPAFAYGPWVESRCSWRELSLLVEFPDVGEYFDPGIMLGSVLDDLRGKEGLDAYADRMRVVVEDVDSGLYAAFDPGD